LTRLNYQELAEWLVIADASLDETSLVKIKTHRLNGHVAYTCLYKLFQDRRKLGNLSNLCSVYHLTETEACVFATVVTKHVLVGVEMADGPRRRLERIKHLRRVATGNVPYMDSEVRLSFHEWKWVNVREAFKMHSNWHPFFVRVSKVDGDVLQTIMIELNEKSRNMGSLYATRLGAAVLAKKLVTSALKQLQTQQPMEVAFKQNVKLSGTSVPAHGVVDFMIHMQNDKLLVVHVKHDLNTGRMFNYLALEMVREQHHLEEAYGLVTDGQFWIFTKLTNDGMDECEFDISFDEREDTSFPLKHDVGRVLGACIGAMDMICNK
jgi:hypothetical protein